MPFLDQGYWDPSVPIPGSDLISFCLRPFTLWFGDWFYVLIMVLLIAMTYLKTQSYDLPITMMLLCGVLGVFIIPDGLVKIVCVVAAAAAAVAMVRLFKS
jgi:hypothetical protein